MVLKILNTLFKITVSVGLIVFLVMRIGMDEILSSLGKTNPLWLLGAIILITASYWLGSVQWALLLKGEEIHLPYRMTLEYYYVGLFFNNFLPSQLGGDMFRMFDIRRTTSDTAAAISTVFLDRVFGLLLMSGLAIFSAPFIIVRHHLNSQFGVFILFLIAGWTLLLFFLFSKRAARPMAWVFEKIVSRRFHIRCRQIYEKIYLFGRKKKLLISVLMISLIVQAARILTHYLLCRALGLSTPVTYFFLFIPAVAILASLPVSIGGLGIREQTAVILFASAGMAGGDATVMEFLAYLVGILTSLPGGLIFALRRRIIPVKEVLSEDSISGNC